MTAQPANTEPSQRPATGLAPEWWARGLTLAERLVESTPARVDESADEQAAQEKLARWRAGYGPDGAARFATRLADTGLTENLLLALLAESTECLAARTARPDWAQTVELALDQATAPDGDEQVPADWREAFAIPLRSLVDVARDQLEHQCTGIEDVDLPAVLAMFAASLRARLAELAVRTFVVELSAQRDAGRLSGADGVQRFADFVRQLAQPASLAGLFTEYPVLARLLGQASQQDVAAHAELLTRFAADRAAIVTTLFHGVDPGRIVSIESAQGDRHANGRAVAIIVFDSDQRLVYRPRDVSTHVQLGILVAWLNQRVPDLDLRTVTTLARDGYGWLEFIPARPVPDLAGADRFYRRQGVLLALLHILHAGDMHHENLIACGDMPVLVDVETLFHPNLPAGAPAADPASAILAESVQRTALLPMIVVGEHGAADLSGLGGDGGAHPFGVLDWEFAGTDRMRLTRRPGQFSGSPNRPRLGERDLDPSDHEAALLAGFRHGYDAILRHAHDFARLLAGCTDLNVRVVVRPTRGYAILLDESTHPDLLRDAADRDRLLDVLWTEAVDQPVRWRLSRYELADLWTGSVPMFTTRPGSHDVWTSDGQRMAGVLATTGMRYALAKLSAMSEVDQHHQEWIISATLATRRPAGTHHSAGPLPGPVSGTAANAQRLLAASCAIADQIMAKGMAADARVNWLGLELVEDQQWLVLPMGAGLANGYLGVALFLAQLAELSGINRFAETARRAIGAVPSLLDMAAARPDMVRLIGSGALYGFGGIAYALARLATLLDDSEVRSWARVAADHAAAADPHGPVDWANGSAGCLAALSAVRSELRESTDGPVAELVRACADRLVDRHDAAAGPGFVSGAAGIGWALATVNGAGDPARIPAAARNAVARAAATPPDSADHGWCTGLAGLTIAQAAVTPNTDVLDSATRMFAERPVLRDMSLCHGELGVTEALTVLAAQVPEAATACRRRAGLVLDAIDRYGPTCGTPGAVSSPGLLNGLAGIGYGLLRLGFSDRVPSVLLLQPGLPRWSATTAGTNND